MMVWPPPFMLNGVGDVVRSVIESRDCLRSRLISVSEVGSVNIFLGTDVSGNELGFALLSGMSIAGSLGSVFMN